MKIVGKDTLYLLSAKTYKVDDGWGYDIYTGDKVYIHQNQVPAISGKRIFLTEEDAKKAAEMVMAKMKKRVIPSLDSMEMVNANIHYK